MVLRGSADNLEAKRRASGLAEDILVVTNVQNCLFRCRGFPENPARAVTAGVGDVTVGSDNNDAGKDTGGKS